MTAHVPPMVSKRLTTTKKRNLFEACADVLERETFLYLSLNFKGWLEYFWLWFEMWSSVLSEFVLCDSNWKLFDLIEAVNLSMNDISCCDSLTYKIIHRELILAKCAFVIWGTMLEQCNKSIKNLSIKVFCIVCSVAMCSVNFNDYNYDWISAFLC